MADRPYTDTDLRHEAALQFDASSEETLDFVGVGEGMEDRAPWNGLDEDNYHEAQRSIHGLRKNASPVGHWAVTLGADGLQPDTDAELTIHASGKPIARVLFAFAPDVDADMRASLVAGLGEAIELHL